MTIEEAIKHCEEIAKDKANIASILWDSKEKARCEDCAEEHRQLAEWLNDYKRLLEQEPCEDAISRQSAIFLASDLKQDLPDDERIADMVMAHNEGILEYQTQLSLLPPITPQPKTGHWIEKDGFDGDTYYDCSECGESWTTVDGTPWNNGMKYCPNCGAKMVEPQENEE